MNGWMGEVRGSDGRLPLVDRNGGEREKSMNC